MHFTSLLNKTLLIALTVSLCSPNAQPQQSLADRYKDNPNTLRGSTELLRLTAKTAPLPHYPKNAIEANAQGLVVIELVVLANGSVKDTRIVEAFNTDAAKTTTEAIRHWVFYSENDLIAKGLLKHCSDCIRINFLAFRFQLDHDKPLVRDLAAEELERQKRHNPFTGQPFKSH